MTKGKTTAGFGEWTSDITKEAIFQDSRQLSSPRVDPWTGRAFFAEARADGANYIVEVSGNGQCRDVLPPSYSARTRVYEYGGDPYAPLPGHRVIFSNASDSAVYIAHVDEADKIKRLFHKEACRYAAFSAQPGDHPWVLAVEEDHTVDKPDQVKNYVVAINTASGEVKRIVSGADFYMFPVFDPSGKRICWTEWNFPDMPWSGNKLYTADFTDDGTVEGVQLVAGEGGMSVTEPRFGPGGCLFFCQEQTNFRQLYRAGFGGAGHTLLTPGTSLIEFGGSKMACGIHSYAILSESCVVARGTDNGSDSLFKINPETTECEALQLPISEVHWDGISPLSPTSVLLVGSGPRSSPAVYRIDLAADGTSKTVLRRSSEQQFADSLFSTPEHIAFPATKGPQRIVHGFFWPPHNPNYQGPDGQKPPLIVLPHGGPTSHTPPGLQLELQYWSSRGYALFAINHTGSSGHGKEYRDLLDGKWGVIDVDDVADSVNYLAASGRIDGSKVGIKGGSAGGYNVLQALWRYPDIFAGGVCLYGISSVALLIQKTHKMESQYADVLLFTEGMTREDREAVMHDRSPRYHASFIRAPLLLLHGEDDKVVPIGQAELVYNDIKERGGEVKFIRFPGEGHGFRKMETRWKALEEEEAWWKMTLNK